MPWLKLSDGRYLNLSRATHTERGTCGDERALLVCFDELGYLTIFNPADIALVTARLDALCQDGQECIGGPLAGTVGRAELVEAIQDAREFCKAGWNDSAVARLESLLARVKLG